MTSLILQALGAMVGAFCGGMGRYGLSRLIPGPPGTFSANLIGCAVLGVAHGLSQHSQFTSPLFVAVVSVGLAGGISTWSTMAKELGIMLQEKRLKPALAYAGLSIACGIIAAWRGAAIATAYIV